MKTGSRQSDSLPVQEIVFCSLLMKLAATSHGDFPQFGLEPEGLETTCLFNDAL